VLYLKDVCIFDPQFNHSVIGKVVNVTADESVFVDGRLDMSLVNAIAFDPYTHGYYKVSERVGEAFKDGLKLKSNTIVKFFRAAALAEKVIASAPVTPARKNSKNQKKTASRSIG
jgi:hypothetical protein